MRSTQCFFWADKIRVSMELLPSLPFCAFHLFALTFEKLQITSIRYGTWIPLYQLWLNTACAQLLRKVYHRLLTTSSLFSHFFACLSVCPSWKFAGYVSPIRFEFMISCGLWLPLRCLLAKISGRTSEIFTLFVHCRQSTPLGISWRFACSWTLVESWQMLPGTRSPASSLKSLGVINERRDDVIVLGTLPQSGDWLQGFTFSVLVLSHAFYMGLASGCQNQNPKFAATAICNWLPFNFARNDPFLKCLHSSAKFGIVTIKPDPCFALGQLDAIKFPLPNSLF